MVIYSVKTHKITKKDTDILAILDTYVVSLKENSILVITSKIISITQGRMVKIGSIDKDELIQQESHYFLPSNSSRYNVSFTITHNMLVPTAGIDESNTNGYYILWPENTQKVANTIREHVKKKFGIKHIGVIITDSRTSPLRWGVTAMAIAYSGFNPLKDYVGEPDLFGRKFVFEKLHIADSLAASAGIVMGEGSEQTPIAIIEDVPQIEFQDRNPTEVELKKLRIDVEDDLYAPFLKNVKWKKGKK